MGSQRKPEPNACQSEELSERPQDDGTTRLDLAGEARLLRPDIHERFVDDKQSALRLHMICEFPQFRALDNASIRVIRIDDNRKVGVEQRLERADIILTVSGYRSRANVFRVGRGKHKRPARLHERHHTRQQDLSPRGGDHIRRRRSVVVARRDTTQFGRTERFGEPGENISRQIELRI